MGFSIAFCCCVSAHVYDYNNDLSFIAGKGKQEKDEIDKIKAVVSTVAIIARLTPLILCLVATNQMQHWITASRDIKCSDQHITNLTIRNAGEQMDSIYNNNVNILIFDILNIIAIFAPIIWRQCEKCTCRRGKSNTKPREEREFHFKNNASEEWGLRVDTDTWKINAVESGKIGDLFGIQLDWILIQVNCMNCNKRNFDKIFTILHSGEECTMRFQLPAQPVTLDDPDQLVNPDDSDFPAPDYSLLVGVAEPLKVDYVHTSNQGSSESAPYGNIQPANTSQDSVELAKCPTPNCVLAEGVTECVDADDVNPANEGSSVSISRPVLGRQDAQTNLLKQAGAPTNVSAPYDAILWDAWIGEVHDEQINVLPSASCSGSEV